MHQNALTSVLDFISTQLTLCWPCFSDFRLLVQAVTPVLELIDIQDTDEVSSDELYTMFAPVNDGVTGSDFYGNDDEELAV